METLPTLTRAQAAGMTKDEMNNYIRRQQQELRAAMNANPAEYRAMMMKAGHSPEEIDQFFEEQGVRYVKGEFLEGEVRALPPTERLTRDPRGELVFSDIPIEASTGVYDPRTGTTVYPSGRIPPRLSQPAVASDDDILKKNLKPR